MAITFTSADLPYRLPASRRVQGWLKELILEESKELGSIVIVWCSDSYLLDINKQYLLHDYFTDIITFDYSEGVRLSGDLLISLDRVRENAREILGDEKLFHVELLRVVAHGVLHLCGYKDKSDDESVVMRAKEDYYMKKYEI